MLDEVEGRSGKKLKPVYQYGNYPMYYSYRLIDRTKPDPRIRMFKREWFEGKHCLDIGCHIGVLPLSIATEYLPQRMLGIEIDSRLAKKAESRRLQLMSKYIDMGNTEISGALERTEFLQGDILSVDMPDEEFDVITCLSVSKWIHFHHGDGGMEALFKRFGHLLRLGGLLVFEPQSIKSYRKAESKQDMSGVPFPLSEMKFMPDQFVGYLVDEVGFSSEAIQILEPGEDGASKGFDRPIYILRKT